MERAFLENPTEYGEFSNTIMGYDESWNLIPQTGAILDSAGKKLEYFKDDPMGFLTRKQKVGVIGQRYWQNRYRL